MLNAVIEYLIESLLCSLVLYLVFVLFFRRSRNFRLNRFTLLFSVVFALAAPLVDLAPEALFSAEVLESSGITGVLSGLPTVAESIQTQTEVAYSLSISDLLMGIYLLISGILLLRFLLNIYPLLSGSIISGWKEHKGRKLALVTAKTAPFSFFRTIYINQDDVAQNGIDDELIAHEGAHARQLHSVDVVLMELVQVFYWFNPVMMLFKRLVRINHEYLADEHVINAGFDITGYSNKLITYSTRNSSLQLASGFDYSSIKNRLLMLTKHDQTSYFFRPIAVFLPMVAALFFLTAFTGSGSMNAVSDDDGGYFYADELYYSGENGKVYLKGNVTAKFGDNDVTGNGTFSFLGRAGLLMINGQEASFNVTIQVSGIKCSIRVLTPEQATEKYGDKGNAGAVEINTKRKVKF